MKPLAVTLYTRPHCPLCDKAVSAMEASGVPIVITRVNIDEDEALRARYTEDIPVILVEGKEAFRHSVDPIRFAEYANGLHAGSTPSLASEHCVPCRGGVPPLEGEALRELQRELGAGWQTVNDHHLEKTFTFPDFTTALAFTNEVGAIAEEQGHHPDILLAWGRVGITIWTHKIDGLTRSDFVLAAKIDALVPQ